MKQEIQKLTFWENPLESLIIMSDVSLLLTCIRVYGL